MVSTPSILTFSIIALLAWVIVRTGASALRLTGVSPDAASFQAVSGFFGVGFTTREAEMIVNHPVRRRIMTHLIVAGNLGITSGLATLVITFVHAGQSDEHHAGLTLAVVLSVVILTVAAARTGVLNRAMDAVIAYTLSKTGAVHVLDYETVLRTHHGYVVEEFEVVLGHELAGRSLRQCALRERGVLVLGLARDGGDYIGTPDPQTELRPGDVLTVYGREEVIKDVLQAR